jgi:hypothetical protein
MSTKELKSEIQRTLENVPAGALQDILAYLKELERHSNEEITFSKNLRKILSDDKELLERLAK